MNQMKSFLDKMKTEDSSDTLDVEMAKVFLETLYLKMVHSPGIPPGFNARFLEKQGKRWLLEITTP